MIDELITTLKDEKLSHQDRLKLQTAIIDKISYIPIADVLEFAPDGTVIVRGRTLDIDQARVLKSGLDALQNNFAEKLISEQLLFNAIKLGVHKSTSLEELMLSKAIIWVLQERSKLLTLLT